jgi:streptogramin lyase
MFARLGARSRWAVFGVSIAVVFGAGGVLTSAAGSSTASSFVPITPCRLFDTRAGTDNVGLRATPVAANDTFVATVWGSNGNCAVPSGATGVSMNVAIVNPTAASFLTVFPADVVRPLSANLNWVAGQAPTPNAVTAALSATGTLGFYNLTGTVDLAVDVVGYYEPSSSGPAGPEGATGPAGPLSNRCAATLRWDLPACRRANVALPAGASQPNALAFDGTSIWSANTGTPNVTRIDPATGTGTNFAVPGGVRPWALAFDGASIWTANNADNSVTRINPTTGAATSFALPAGAGAPYGLAFDGTYLWTANNATPNVTRIDPATGIGTNFALPGTNQSFSIAFDGTFLWTANYGTNNVTRIDPATGIGTNFALPAGAFAPISVAFDGINIWVANASSPNVTRFVTATGAGTNFALPAGVSSSTSIGFDGSSIWTSNFSAGNVTRINPTTGIGTNVALPLGAVAPAAMTFDGRNVWIANKGSANVTRLVP